MEKKVRSIRSSAAAFIRVASHAGLFVCFWITLQGWWKKSDRFDPALPFCSLKTAVGLSFVCVCVRACVPFGDIYQRCSSLRRTVPENFPRSIPSVVVRKHSCAIYSVARAEI